MPECKQTRVPSSLLILVLSRTISQLSLNRSCKCQPTKLADRSFSPNFPHLTIHEKTLTRPYQAKRRSRTNRQCKDLSKFQFLPSFAQQFLLTRLALTVDSKAKLSKLTTSWKVVSFRAITKIQTKYYPGLKLLPSSSHISPSNSNQLDKKLAGPT